MESTIFGYTWDQIVAAQQGKQFRPYIAMDGEGRKPANKEDVELLMTNGLEKLKEMGFNGVIDRLTTSGLIL